MPDAIAVFARAPVPGQVKTRLAKHLGDEAAAGLYAAMLRDTLALAKRAARDRPCEVVVAFTPEAAFEPGPFSLSNFWHGTSIAQRGDDLGARMLNCFADLRSQGFEKIVLIGSDCPNLPPAYVSQSLSDLKSQNYVSDPLSGEKAVQNKHQLVLGPARDGGFYLIGTSILLPGELFANVEWSARNTLKQVLANAARLGLLISPRRWSWHDIDTPQDLRKLITWHKMGRSHAPETWRWLRTNGFLD